MNKSMNKSMKLSQEREAIFKEQVSYIKAEGMKCFGLLSEFDDLYQLLLINYAIALQNADLTVNFHAFCMKRGMWACYRELNKNKLFKQNHKYLEDIKPNLDYDLVNVYLQIDSENDNRLEYDVALNEGLAKIIRLHSRLLPQEKLVVNSVILGDKTSLPSVKVRRQQMIAKEFKIKVREILSAA